MEYYKSFVRQQYIKAIDEYLTENPSCVDVFTEEAKFLGKRTLKEILLFSFKTERDYEIDIEAVSESVAESMIEEFEFDFDNCTIHCDHQSPSIDRELTECIDSPDTNFQEEAQELFLSLNDEDIRNGL